MVWFLVPFEFSNHLAEKDRAVCFTLIVLCLSLIVAFLVILVLKTANFSNFNTLSKILISVCGFLLRNCKAGQINYSLGLQH